jgi:hypothetical protein
MYGLKAVPFKNLSLTDALEMRPRVIQCLAANAGAPGVKSLPSAAKAVLILDWLCTA